MAILSPLRIAGILRACLLGALSAPAWAGLSAEAASKTDWTELSVVLQFWDDFDHGNPVLRFAFHRTAEGWKWVVSDKTIENYVRYYRRVPFELADPAAVPGIAWYFRSA